MFWRPPLPTVSFATSCWKRDWRLLLLHPDYLRLRQIENHSFPFQERLLIINNVADLEAVKQAAQAKVDEGVLSRFLIAEEMAQEVLSFFQLSRSDLRVEKEAHPHLHDDWLYYNALGPLTAIYACKSDYLLYLTGDVRLEQEVNWIPKALRKMEKHSRYKVANLLWNHKKKEAARESYRRTWNFYIAKQGFSDQFFLVKCSDFRRPIYGEIRSDASHFPRGDVFEKRVFSYMKNRGWERITYRRGSYIHENI